jgi:TonB family protein
MADGHDGDENCRLLLQELHGASSLFQCFLEFTRGYFEGPKQSHNTPKTRLPHPGGHSGLSISVNQGGVPRDITVIQSLGLGLDEKAKECVAQWRFRPSLKEGKAVRVNTRVEVNFPIQKPM